MNTPEDLKVRKIKFVDFMSSLNSAGTKDFASFHPYLSEVDVDDRTLLLSWVEHDLLTFTRLELDLCSPLRKVEKQTLFLLNTKDLFLFCVVLCIAINASVL